MIFSTYKFIFLFFPITFCGYFLLGKYNQNVLMKIWLVAASLVFYAQGDPNFFPVFVLSIVFNYIFGTGIGRLALSFQKKGMLALGVLANILLLGYYKYTNFFLENVNALTGLSIPLKTMVLPIGISFFTFQLIAYLIDSYRGKTQNYDILDYLLFITFFPQLIVGPIIHHGEAVPQFADEKNQKINPQSICIGLLMFSMGCAKKLLLADPLTENAQLFFDVVTGVPDMLSAWYHSIEYTVSYYFDLSAYADMAIGLGYFFNIKLPENFNSPYKARDFQDYWRRWHMTLSRFLSDYVFRSYYDKTKRFHGYYAATMVTFFVSGFWHGAGWTFVAWGLVNGALVCVAAYLNRKGIHIPGVLAYPLTALGVVLCRVLFVSDSFETASFVFRGMFRFRDLAQQFSGALPLPSFDMKLALLLLIGIVVCWFFPNSGQIRERFIARLDEKSGRAYPYIVAAGVLFSLSLMFMNKVATFLYFQF